MVLNDVRLVGEAMDCEVIDTAKPFNLGVSHGKKMAAEVAMRSLKGFSSVRTTQTILLGRG